jgi:4-aminobutyrate aminotransferase/(S)-3-amino-2-methylpropionate transaminase
MLATGRAGVLAFEGGYHGLSHGPLAACGLRPSFREPFAAQLNAHVVFAPYPRDAASLGDTMAAARHALSSGEVGAVLVEPILGRGGCVVPPAAFLPLLSRACAQSGALLVCDEIWTGLGRSGAWLASVDAGVVPDLVCLGKGLGGGLPISACIGRASAMAAWGAHGGTTIHTATHFGAPPACAAALATLDALADESLEARARELGPRWAERLRDKLRGCGVIDVRGRGLMIGVELVRDRKTKERAPDERDAVVEAAFRRGLLLLGAGKNSIRFSPPLVLTTEQADTAATIFDEALTDVERTSARR